MATTYRAHDTVLHSAVALKIIGQNVAGHPTARARFLREARAAAKLHHPNIASVSHYGEQGGLCYYAMELVEGETLEARVRRQGPLSSALVLDIGVQVARALAAAEAAGVVHRDLKPTNIMLATRMGETEANDALIVKVIDWGLAKAVSAESALGVDHTEGGFVGTPAYASPEQFARTLDRPLDTRSDIYSLGVTLWYLLCGSPPFVGRTLGEIHSRQTEQPLPLGTLRANGVSEPVVALLTSMLAVDPAARPQSARELLQTLRRCQEQCTATAKPAGHRGRRVLTAVLLATVFAATIGFAVSRWIKRAVILEPSERTVAVLPFENRSPDPADAFFTTGVQDQITADLAKVASLKLVESDGAKAYPAGKSRDLLAIGRELGVRHLLTGSLERRGDRVHVAVTLTDVRDLARPWQQQYDLRLSDVFAVQGSIARAVAGRLQATLSPEEKASINRPPTTNLQAYDLYLRARQELPNPSSANDVERRNAQRQIDLLERAIKLDPDFALAYCALAACHDRIFANRPGSSMEELAVDHRGLAESALDTARRLQPDLDEVHLAAAYHYYYVVHDYAKAHDEIEAARRTLPNSARLERRAGDIARRRGRWEEAIRCYQRADGLEPHRGDSLERSMVIYHVLRRYDDFVRVGAEIAARRPGATNNIGERARIAFESRADLGPWREYLVHPPDDDPPNDEEPMIVATYSGDADEMDRTLAASKLEVFMISEVPYPRAWYTALAASVRGDDKAAREAFALARPTIENEVRIDPTANRPLSTLAIIDAALGRKEDAIREAQRACDLAPFDGAAMNAPIARCDLAVVYAWTGEIDKAFTELDKVVALPYTGVDWPDRPSYGDLRCSPLWKPLRADARFESVLKRLAPVPSP